MSAVFDRNQFSWCVSLRDIILTYASSLAQQKNLMHSIIMPELQNPGKGFQPI